MRVGARMCMNITCVYVYMYEDLYTFIYVDIYKYYMCMCV